MTRRIPLLAFVAGMLISALFSGTASAQSAAVITKSFTPDTVPLNGMSVATITVTNPNAVLPLTSVQFSDTMPAGVDLITQTGGTCSTPATGGGMFTINPGTETFSSTSSVLAGGQSCTITVSVRGTVIGTHLNTTSQVTSSNAPPGPAASATLTVTGPPSVLSVTRAGSDPTVGPTVDFTVTFSESVTGVDAADFALTTTGAIAGATVTGVSGSGATRTVTVSTGTGGGTLRLDVIDNDTIIDVDTQPLGGVGVGNGNFTGGQQYLVIVLVAPTITKSFNPSTIFILENSEATITVTNPNVLPISNVQFSDTMPAGIDLITQTGGTCSTLATGGGMFSINPGTETFSSTSSVLTAGQACTITVRVRGIAVGQFVNTTSQVTATATPSGGPASATLTVLAPTVPTPTTIPALGPWQLAAIAALLMLLGGQALRRRGHA